MAKFADQSLETRRKYVNAWNDTMIRIWKERISTEKPNGLGVVNTGALLASPIGIRLKADDGYRTIEIKQGFLEYGLWQDMGVGREVYHDNPGDIGRDKVREPRRWFSPAYFRSVLRIRDFMGESLANEFRDMLCSQLDSDKMKHSTEFYKRKGYV